MVTAPIDPRGPRATKPYRFSDVTRSEWTKFRSVRSTYWTFFIAALLGVGLAALICWISADHYASDPEIRFGWNPIDRSLRAPFFLTQLAFAVLGVLTVTSEYSTGMIRTSLAAVPKRVRMMSAKLLVYALCAVVIGEAIAFAAFGVGQALIHGKAPSASLSQHDVLRIVIGAGLYLMLIGVLSAAFGVILRQAAAGIAVIVAVLFILPLIGQVLPTSWSQPFEKYWPTNAGQQIYAARHDAHTLGAWAGFGEMVLFVVVVIAVSFYVLQRRDA